MLQLYNAKQNKPARVMKNPLYFWHANFTRRNLCAKKNHCTVNQKWEFTASPHSAQSWHFLIALLRQLNPSTGFRQTSSWRLIKQPLTQKIFTQVWMLGFINVCVEDWEKAVLNFIIDLQVRDKEWASKISQLCENIFEVIFYAEFFPTYSSLSSQK